MNDRCVLTGVLVALTGLWASAAAQTAPVTITGGADETGHNYKWSVKNNHGSRLVYIEFSEYRGDLFFTPPDWKQDFVNRCGPGWKDADGLCKAWPKPPYAGLGQGETAQFGLRIEAAGALRGKGSMRVKFEDGTEATIDSVELPQKAGSSPRMAMFAMIGLFVVIIVIREWRIRRKRAVAVPGEAEPPVSGAP